MGCQAARAEEAPVFSREDEFLGEIRRHLMDRKAEFSIKTEENIGILYGDDSEYLFSEVFELEESGSDDFDYLRYNVKEPVLTVKEVDQKVCYQFKVSYYDTLAKAGAVNKAVNKALKELALAGDAAGTKAVKIHDYIVRDASLCLGQSKSSAHDALKKSASSRGYALLTYKMMREAGIPCRIVAGKVGNTARVWNMIQLDGSWYYMDNAADAAGVSRIVPVRYTYFLVGKTTLLRNHALAQEYQTVDFESGYPASEEDYAGRGRLILASDAARTKEKTGVGPFNEMYDKVSNLVVDPLENLNDKISNSLLDRLEGVFGAA